MNHPNRTNTPLERRHPDESELLAHLDGTQAPEIALLTGIHLESCLVCRLQVEWLREVREALAGASAPQPDNVVSYDFAAALDHGRSLAFGSMDSDPPARDKLEADSVYEALAADSATGHDAGGGWETILCQTATEGLKAQLLRSRRDSDLPTTLFLSAERSHLAHATVTFRIGDQPLEVTLADGVGRIKVARSLVGEKFDTYLDDVETRI